MPKLNFRGWLAESFSDPNDQFSPNYDPALAVFKLVVPTPDIAGWQTRMTDLGDENPGLPPVENGYWKLHDSFHMDEPQEGEDDEHTIASKTWLKKNPEVWHHYKVKWNQAVEEAKRVVAEEPDTYASVIARIHDGMKLPWQEGVSMAAAFVATSPARGKKAGRKNVSSVFAPSRGFHPEYSDTAFENAIRKCLAAFGLDRKRLPGSPRDKDVRQSLYPMLWPNQAKAFKWVLVLTPQGWRVAGRDGKPDRRRDVPFYAWNYDGQHDVLTTTQWSGSRWSKEDLAIRDPNHGWRHIMARPYGTIDQHRRNQESGKEVSRWSHDYVHPGSLDLAAQAMTGYNREFERYIDNVPWMTPSLRHLAHIFNLTDEQWQASVWEAILRAIDDEDFQRGPTAAPKVPKGEDDEA